MKLQAPSRGRAKRTITRPRGLDAEEVDAEPRGGDGDGHHHAVRGPVNRCRRGRGHLMECREVQDPVIHTDGTAHYLDEEEPHRSP